MRFKRKSRRFLFQSLIKIIDIFTKTCIIFVKTSITYVLTNYLKQYYDCVCVWHQSSLMFVIETSRGKYIFLFFCKFERQTLGILQI